MSIQSVVVDKTISYALDNQLGPVLVIYIAIMKSTHHQ